MSGEISCGFQLQVDSIFLHNWLSARRESFIEPTLFLLKRQNARTSWSHPVYFMKKKKKKVKKRTRGKENCRADYSIPSFVLRDGIIISKHARALIYLCHVCVRAYARDTNYRGSPWVGRGKEKGETGRGRKAKEEGTRTKDRHVGSERRRGSWKTDRATERKGEIYRLPEGGRDTGSMGWCWEAGGRNGVETRS